MKPRTEQSKLRKWSRRVGKCLVGLVLLAGVALLLADVWHQYTLGQSVEELRETIAQVERDVQGGVPARDWHETRIKGSNGWKHVKFLWELPEAVDFIEENRHLYSAENSEQCQLWDALEQLQAYDGEMWEAPWPDDRPKGYVPRTSPNHEELNTLLHKTRMVPDALRLANQCDIVTPLPKEGTAREEWTQQIRIYTRFSIGRAMLGRSKALRELGRVTEAEQELADATAFAAKFKLPLNFVDGLCCMEMAETTLEYAELLLSQRLLSKETATDIVELDFDGDALFREAVKADAVWLVLMLGRDANLLQDPRWFEWMSRRTTAVDGQELSTHPYDLYGHREEECDNCTRALLNDMRSIDQVQRKRPWAEIADTRPAGPNYYGLEAEYLPDQSIRFRRLNVAWLALRVRLFEMQIGPLAEHREEVNELVAQYAFARHEWEGDTLLLYPVTAFDAAPGDEISSGDYPTTLAPAK